MSQYGEPLTRAQEPKKRNTAIIIAVVVLILLCCFCAILAYLGYQYGDYIMQYFGFY